MDAGRVSRIFIAFIVLLFAAHAAAQSTRVETIAKEQAEKSKQLGVEGPSEGERIIRGRRTSGLDEVRFRVFP